MPSLLGCICEARGTIHVRRIKLPLGIPAKLLHMSDMHYKGDPQFLDKIITLGQSLDVNYVTVTGD